jgi:hypothetical protein
MKIIVKIDRCEITKEGIFKAGNLLSISGKNLLIYGNNEYDPSFVMNP